MSQSDMSSSPLGVLGFCPQNLVEYKLGKLSVKLYPTITPTMPIPERAHAYQVNKSALLQVNAEIRPTIDLFAIQLNCSTTVDGLCHDWIGRFKSQWHNFANLEIMSFHDSAGGVMNTTTTNADHHILLPIQNGILADCRSQDVKFVLL